MLQNILSRYDLFLVDIAGVVHDGVQPYPGVVAQLNALTAGGKTVLFLSNNPRPGEIVAQQLLDFGVQPGFKIFTSGDLTRFLLAHTYRGQPIFHFGRSRNLALTQGLTLNLVEDVSKAALVLLTAFLEEGESMDPWLDVIDTLVAHNVPVLCANPDKIAMHGKTTRRCAGTFAELIQQKGGTVMFSGKPDPQIYEALESAFPELPFKKDRMLMIGDTLETDVLGGHQFGMDTLLVLTGNTGNMLRHQRQDLKAYLAQHPNLPKPTWVGETLTDRVEFFEA